MALTKKTRLYELRKKNHLTQEQAAALLGVSKSYYIKIESGHCEAGRGFVEKFIKVFPYEDVRGLFE